MYRRKTQQAIWNLSYNGRQLKDEETLDNFQLEDGATLMGAYSITVFDKECGTQTDVKVYAYNHVNDLIDRYMHETKRVRHYGSKLLFEGKDFEYDDTVQGPTLHELSIRENTSLQWKGAEYSVKLRDQKQNKDAQLHVYDHFDVRTLKTLYVNFARENFDEYTLAPEEFKLFFQGREMVDDDKLYQYGQYKLGNHSVIDLQHEELKMSFKYQCWDCGAIVAIKAADPIRCRACDGRVLMKLRKKTSEHIAR
mmetsp:Transcript_12045/g.17948  ORF Transcript_12045/g.17948 Transcript_12045/m.17948 type:complete len:252 (+) Transcript_12045:176-931(+)